MRQNNSRATKSKTGSPIAKKWDHYINELVQELLPGDITHEHLEWFIGLTKIERDRYVREAEKKVSEANSFNEFASRKHIGTIVVPNDYHHFTYLELLSGEYSKLPELFSQHLRDENFAMGTTALVPGMRFEVSAFEITKATSSDHCVQFIKNQGGTLIGPYGLGLLCKQLKGDLPIALRLLSFDELHSRQEVADRHRIPVLTVHKMGPPSFKLAYPTGVRAAGDILICFSKIN